MKNHVLGFVDGDDLKFSIEISDDMPKGIIANHGYKNLTLTPESAKEVIASLQSAIDIFESDFYQWTCKKVGRID